MPDNVTEPVWLVGAGPMAVAYSRVLDALDTRYLVVGRSESTARKFEKETGKSVVTGGVEALIQTNPTLPDIAIVAVGVDCLANVSCALLHAGVHRILTEKPGGMTFGDIETLARTTHETAGSVVIGYNRRFYASTQRAREMIAEDGGVRSFHFEFTEWSHVVGKLDIAPAIKENWFMANSSHVIDMAFHLGGWPEEMCCNRSGGLAWHPSGSVYSGSGVADTGALFSYHADWEAPGRWSVEMMTRKHRFLLRPLETLQVQKIGSGEWEHVVIDDGYDKSFKPGLFREVDAFLQGDLGLFTGIEEQERHSRIYKKIAGITTR